MPTEDESNHSAADMLHIHMHPLHYTALSDPPSLSNWRYQPSKFPLKQCQK